MHDQIAEHETSEAGDIGSAVVEAGADTATTEPAAEAVETPVEAAAPAWTPEQIASLREMPEFRDLLTEEAGQIADQRLEQRLQQFQQPSGNEGDFDANEFLNPMSDDFGKNLFTMLNHFAQQAQAPILQQQQQARVAEGEQRMADIIADDFSRNGPIELGDGAPDPKQVIQQIAPLYLGEMQSRFGETPRAGEAALGKATQLIRSIVTAAEKRGASQNANQLATLSSANSEPGTAAGAIRAAGEASSVDEALARWRGEPAAA